MNRYKKYRYIIVAFIVVCIVGADSFIIKKAKEVVIPYKDQAIASIIEFLSWSPTLISTQGNIVAKIAELQEEMMKIVQGEFEGKEHLISNRSASDLKNIRNATQKIQDQLKQMNQQILLLCKELDAYKNILHNSTEQRKKI